MSKSFGDSYITIISFTLRETVRRRTAKDWISGTGERCV